MAEVGRPTVMTESVINKLEEVFAIGGTDKEACFYADISHQTLYDYQEKHPEFVERKEALKQRPVLKARQTVVKALDNPEDARWFLSRKMKKEFSERQELTGADGGKLTIEISKEIADKNELTQGTENHSG
jgi:hypothetical protein